MIEILEIQVHTDKEEWWFEFDGHRHTQKTKGMSRKELEKMARYSIMRAKRMPPFDYE